MSGLPLPDAVLARREAFTACWFAPGRVNLLGEHIDYVGGTVLPMALQFGTHALARPLGFEAIRVTSLDRGETLEIGLDRPVASGWGAFVAGAVQILCEEGIELRGTEIVVCGNLPARGLSSSASFACVLLRSLADAAGVTPAPLSIARWARRVEHEHVGVQCGLMDQAAVCLCAPESVLAFDCGRETGGSLPLAPEVAVLVLGTGVERRLAESAYNERQREARMALAGQVPSGPSGELIRRRGRHVASEMQRVREGIRALEAGDYAAFGALMAESHRSLRDDFEVSCPELDLMVEVAEAAPGVFGARMTGAGFGGAAVALVDAARADAALEEIERVYRSRCDGEPTLFRAQSHGPLQRIDGT